MRKRRRSLPLVTLALAGGLICIGFLFLNSSTSGTVREGLVLRQLKALALAVPLFLLAAALPLRRLAECSFSAYWLVLGLLGGLGSVFIMEGFEEALTKYKELFFFTPLIAAMAGNVGVQSSAIIVQGLANNVVKGSLFSRLLKEVSLSLINGIALGVLVIICGYITALDERFSFTIALSMLCVIIVAALIGTFIPILLHKRGIDPAIATGPFITTSNDIFGIFLFFYVAKTILGF